MWLARVLAATMIEVSLPRLAPMLASPGPLTGTQDQWAFEPKLDGWRVLVYFDDHLTVRTRGGHDVSQAVPELAGGGCAPGGPPPRPGGRAGGPPGETPGVF